MCEVHHHPKRRAAGASAPRSAVGRVAHAAIRLYQLTLSGFMGRQCRYEPSCSHYTDDAIGRYGLWAGGWMGLARILRCNPWGASGYDPIPDALPENWRWWAPWRGARWTGRHIDPSTRWD